MSDWIEWKGGECPVAEDTLVEVRLSGINSECTPTTAGSLYWNMGSIVGSIIAYRVCVRSETGAIPSVEQDALRVYNGPLNLPALTVGPVEFTEKQMDALISHMNCDLPPLEKIHQDALRNYNGPLPMPAAPPLPTPRTDALENDTQNLRQGEWDSKALELARTLEREAAELRVAIAAWKREEDSWIEREAALTALQSREEAGRVSVPMIHQGECATDESAKQVCEGMYTDKVDEVLSLIEALESIATLNAGSDEQAQAVRQMALKAIAEQGTDIDAAGEARTELRAMLSAAPAPAAQDVHNDASGTRK